MKMTNETKTNFAVTETDPLLFAAPELEEAVVGALLVEREAIVTVENSLRPEMFFSDGLREIYRAILSRRESGQAVDLLTVTEELRRRGTLEQTGGAYFITGLSGKVASAAHLEDHVEIIRQYYLRRELILGLHRMLAAATDRAEALYDTLNRAQELFNAIIQDCPWQTHLKEMPQVMEETFREGESRAERSRLGVTGIPTGLAELDRITGGWQPGNEIVLAAKTGHGKTALSLFFARQAAKAGYRVLVCSLEMTAAELGNRWMLSECDIDPYRWKAGTSTPEELVSAACTAEKLKKLPIRVHDGCNTGMDDICAAARALHARKECDLVIVDYLQLCRVRQTGRTREQEVAENSRKAKMLARDLSCPVIVLSQLNRDVDNRPDQIPRLGDLRESGAIEQDADLVILLYRPEKAGLSTDSQTGYPTRGLGIGIVAKHRNGECGKVYFGHNPSMTRIGEYEPTGDWIVRQARRQGKSPS